jgi:hypothetical protein
MAAPEGQQPASTGGVPPPYGTGRVEVTEGADGVARARYSTRPPGSPRRRADRSARSADPVRSRRRPGDPSS